FVFSYFFFQAEDGIRDFHVTGVQTCALPICAMQPGDLFLFYHSSCPRPGVAGIGRILGEAYPDPTALQADSHYFDVKATPERNPWSAVDVGFVETFDDVIELARLKAEPALSELPLVRKGSRLSVMPVTPAQWEAILRLR